ncbi:MAG: ABC transporter ATP-binding protein [Propionibacteriaceae bacterium]|jgi:putative ABC transport system ATP-binding protein|nr:ABC transporter ATP-binding protein [Propionibacteriaceae bacterium]
MTDPVVEWRQVARTYPGPPAVHALEPTDLTIWPGDFAAVVGPSGSGKSTLLNVLGLLNQPTAGSYRLDGVATEQLTPAQRAGVRGRRIGFVFQSFHLLNHRTVLDNVALAGTYDKTPRATRLARAAEVIDLVGLTPRLGALPSTLSGGERQRVAIARALAARPTVLLCDEPTGNLDSARSQEIIALFETMHQAGFTIVMVTHDETLAARARRRLDVLDGVVRETERVRP